MTKRLLTITCVAAVMLATACTSRRTDSPPVADGDTVELTVEGLKGNEPIHQIMIVPSIEDNSNPPAQDAQP